MSKKIDAMFSAMFIAMIVLPLILISTNPAGNTKYENRALAKWPSFHDEQGKFSRQFFSGFENWFSDHIGLRDSMIKRDALIQYYVFRTLKIMQPFTIVLGPHGELAGIPNLDDYQHRKLFTEEELKSFERTLTTIRDYLLTKGCQFYYMQCYDKHHIYPEQFPKSIIQYGEMSKADQLVQTITDNTDINTVHIKEPLLRGKKSYNVYGKWTDPWHWNQRGAVIAYGELMKAINRDNPEKYKILDENDFTIETKDLGMTYFSMIHQADMTESFTVKESHAVRDLKGITPELHFMEENPNAMHFNRLYLNENADNGDTLLLIADSYILDYMLLFLAESFHRTVICNLASLHDDRFIKLVETYQPKIVVFESVERESWHLVNLHDSAHAIAEMRK